MSNMSRTTKAATAILILLWLTVGANALHLIGHQMPIALFNWALSALIVASLLDGIVLIVSGPGFYRALRVGEEIGERKERRRHRCPTATTAVPTSRRAGATTG